MGETGAAGGPVLRFRSGQPNYLANCVKIVKTMAHILIMEPKLT
jgi:hypothetical protein